MPLMTSTPTTTTKVSCQLDGDVGRPKLSDFLRLSMIHLLFEPIETDALLTDSATPLNRKLLDAERQEPVKIATPDCNVFWKD
jgi:hypothetical protein